MLDHTQLAADHFKALGKAIAQLGEARAATAAAGGAGGRDPSLARDVGGKGLAAVEGGHLAGPACGGDLVGRGHGFRLFDLELRLV